MREAGSGLLMDREHVRLMVAMEHMRKRLALSSTSDTLSSQMHSDATKTIGGKVIYAGAQATEVRITNGGGVTRDNLGRLKTSDLLMQGQGCYKMCQRDEPYSLQMRGVTSTALQANQLKQDNQLRIGGSDGLSHCKGLVVVAAKNEMELASAGHLENEEVDLRKRDKLRTWVEALEGGTSYDSNSTRAFWKEQQKKCLDHDEHFKILQHDIQMAESLIASFQKTFEWWPSRKKTISSAFTLLSKEEETEVENALNGPISNAVLVTHERSNIDITRAVMQCLRPRAWLNDEVINLYLELLKERELREPGNFLKCHFFNTFFFNKLYRDSWSYDFKAVRRWTTQRRLGYSILDCEKIFVPIHKDIHWCMAVIDLRKKKLLYLDSLKGHDENALQILANYITDEAKDKLNKNIDARCWNRECLDDIPEQLNGCDCGMFMIKYADFYSRGDELNFSQGDMDYFRKRTVLELLRLKAT